MMAVAVKLVRKWSHWWRTSETVIARWLRAAHAALLGEMPILAAGTALFAILAVVPTLAAAVAIYGLIADPHEIQSVLASLESVLPTEVVQFIGSQLERQAARGNTELGLQLVASVLVAVLSSRASARSLIDALNRAYRVRELRSPLVKFGISVTMAIGTLFGLIAMLALLIVLPALVGAVNQNWIPIAMWLRWPALLAVLFATLAALYRYAPSPRPLGPQNVTDAGGPINLPHRPVHHVCLPGAVIATVLLLLVSWGLSLYVERVASSEIIRGAFGSVIVTLLWFYLSTIALVIGGFVNAELERHRGAPQPERSMY
jgi:membrane protein